MNTRSVRRSLHLLTSAMLAALVLAGCGSDDSGESNDSSGSDVAGEDGAAANDGAFPVTIEHALGETTIESAPERVATWGPTGQDITLALGVTPVAMPHIEYGGDDDGVLPWFREELGDSELPALVPNVSGEEIPYEALAEAQPDVILAVYSGITAEQYETLSQIAPTVAYPDAPWSTPWQDQTRVIGEALGLAAEADQLVTDTEAYLDQMAADYPQLDGKTFIYSTEDDGQLGIFTSDDVRVRLLTDLGLTVAPYVDENATGDTVYYFVSAELAADIDTDILVAWFNDPSAADAFAADPLFSQNPAMQSGAYAPIVGESYVAASSAPSVLSIPWMLDDYVPQLAEAADAAN